MTANRSISPVFVLAAVLALSGTACHLFSPPANLTVAATPAASLTALPAASLPTSTGTPSPLPTATDTDIPSPTFTPTATWTPTRPPVPTPTPVPSPTPRPVIPPRQPLGFEAQPPPGVSGVEAQLWAEPIIPAPGPRVWAIFEAGRAMGNRAGVFSKVGDCHTAAHAFLLPLGVGEYDLGPYDFLQADITFFSSVSPRQGVPNAFENQSMAASSAFNAAAVLDSIWADPTHCQPGESPLVCEYRLVRPAIAIITLGSVDVQIYSAEQFRASLNEVVQTTIGRGIIPVLVNFPTHPDYFWEQSLAFNAVILDIARQERIPLVNLWRASRQLPNYGLEGDNFHFAHPEDRFISFNGHERQYAVTLHNLLTLLMLDTLRVNVLGG